MSIETALFVLVLIGSVCGVVYLAAPDPYKQSDK